MGVTRACQGHQVGAIPFPLVKVLFLARRLADDHDAGGGVAVGKAEIARALAQLDPFEAFLRGGEVGQIARSRRKTRGDGGLIFLGLDAGPGRGGRIGSADARRAGQGGRSGRALGQVIAIDGIVQTWLIRAKLGLPL